MAKFTIAGIIQTIDHQLFCYDTTFRTYKEALIFTDNTLKMIVVVSYINIEGGLSYQFLDGAKIITDYLTGGPKVVFSSPYDESPYDEFHVDSWETFEIFINRMYDADITLYQKYLTYTAVPGVQHYIYKGTVRTRITPFTANMEDAVQVISLGYTNDIEGSYTNVNTPKIRNISHRRVHLPDLVFTKTAVDSEINFKNTLVSVDGIVCFPVYSAETDELYARNGARFLCNTTDSNSLNILLMDFSKMGDMDHYKLSECKQELIVKSGTKLYQYYNPGKGTTLHMDPSVEFWQDAQLSLRFALPEGATNGTPILSIAGRLFMPGMDDIFTYEQDGRVWVEFHISAGILENIIASNLQHQNLFFKKSSFFRIVLSYVFCNMFVDQAYEYDEGTDTWLAIQFYMDQIIPFISILHTDKPLVINRNKPICVFGKGKIIFPKDSRGLLMNDLTREFIDYTRIPYKDQLLATFSIQNPLFVQDRDGNGINQNRRISMDFYDFNTVLDMMPVDPTTRSQVYFNIFEKRYKLITNVQEHTLPGLDPYDESITVPITKSIFAISEELPYVKDGNDDVIIYEWSDIESEAGGTIPVYHAAINTWVLYDDSGLVIALSDIDTAHTDTSYQNLHWFKTMPPNAGTIKWYLVVEGNNVIPDGVKFDRMGWDAINPHFLDQYNRVTHGEYVKDPHHYSMLFICTPSETGDSDLLDDNDNPAKQADPEDDLSNPMVPVLTVEKERVKDPIKIGRGIAPAELTQIRVMPTFVNGDASTSLLTVKYAENIDRTLGIYDGQYQQTVDGEVGTARIWRQKADTSITIQYGEYNGQTAWLIKKNDDVIFFTDLADTGSAPYNTVLTWSYVNA